MFSVVQARLVGVCLLCIFATVVWFDLFQTVDAAGSGVRVSYLDVGQGDATLIEVGEVQVLIDGGKDNSVLRELGRALGFWDRNIDVVIATHPDADHVGGLADVLARYEVGQIVVTENESDSPAAAAFAASALAEGATITYARAGQEFMLGASTTLRVLFPDRGVGALESNTSSIVLQLIYGDTEFIFTGDSPQSIEEYLVSQYGIGLESEVLKVGHHGSKTSTADTFVAAVEPELAVISAGCDNRYGHPHQEVLDTLGEIETLNTCDSGTIVVESDGTNVWVR